MGVAYSVVVIIFFALASHETLTVEHAYDVMEGPIMALIGGTLAISKDLIPLGTEENLQQGGPHEEHQGSREAR